MRKGQKLSKATNYSRELQKRRIIKEDHARERQRTRQSTRSASNKPKRSKRPATKYSNKYTYTPSSPDIIDKVLEGFWNFVFNVFEKIFRSIFR